MATQQKFYTVLPDNSVGPTMDYTGISSVYTSKANRSGQMEMVMQANDIDVSLSSTSFGTRGVAYITPSTSLLKQVVLELKIDGAWGSDWTGYSALREFGYRLPGCERMIFTGDNMIFKPLSECEEYGKRIQLLKANGMRSRTQQYRRDDTGTATPASNYYYPILKDAGPRYVYCILPLPCSSASATDGTMPFPLHMLQSSLELDFLFRYDMETQVPTSLLDTLTTQTYASNFDTANSPATKYSPDTAKMLGSRLYYVYESLPNMDMYKDTVYKYPFQALYDNYISVTVDEATQQKNIQNDVPLEFKLNGLRNGEITQIAFRLTPDPSLIGNRRYNGLKLKDIKLTYAGQTIYRSPNDSDTLWSCFYNTAENSWCCPQVLNFDTASDVKTFYNLNTKIAATNTVPHVHSSIVNMYSMPMMSVEVLEAAREHVLQQSNETAITGNGMPVSGNGYNCQIIQDNVASGPQYYYIIPIAEALDHIRKGAYNLGCDFKDSDLRLSFKVVPQGIKRSVDSSGTATTDTYPVYASVQQGRSVTAQAKDWESGTTTINNFILNYQISINSQYQFDGLSAKLIQ